MAKPLGYDISIQGNALNTRGFNNFGAFEGLGLLSYGFLWIIDKLWSVTYDEDVTSSSWSTAESSITTSWSTAESSLTTSWTDYDTK